MNWKSITQPKIYIPLLVAVLAGVTSLFLITPTAAGINRYVDVATGSNAGSNTCTDPAKPCQTIIYASTQMNQSDIMNIVPSGNYDECLHVAFGWGGIPGGVSGSPTTMKSTSPTTRVHIRPVGVLHVRCETIVEFWTRDYITMDGLEVDCSGIDISGDPQNPPFGVKALIASHFFTLQNSSIHDCGNGLGFGPDQPDAVGFVRTASPYFQPPGPDIYRPGIDPLPTPDRPGKPFAPSVSPAMVCSPQPTCYVKNNRVINNVFYNLAGYGCYCFASATVWEHNTYHDIGGYAIATYIYTPCTMPPTDCVLYQPGTGAPNHVRQNFIYNAGSTTQGPSMSPANSFYFWGSVYFYNNVIIGTGSTTTVGEMWLQNTQTDLGTNFPKIYSNTIWGYQRSAIVTNGSLPFDIQGNIIYGNGALCTITSSDGPPCPGVSDGSIVANNFTSNPLFVNPQRLPPQNFKLQMGSTAVGNGKNWTNVLCNASGFPTACVDLEYNARPATGNWTAGAYEGTGGNPPPNNPPPIDDFVYSTGSNLSGQGAVVNHWTGAWTTQTGTITAEVPPTGTYTAGNAARNLGGGWYYRRFDTVSTASVTNGTAISFQMHWINAVPSGNFAGTLLGDASNPNLATFALSSDGNLHMCPGFSNDTVLHTPSLNTWYFYEVELDSSGHPNAFRARVNGGTFSAWISFCGSATSPAMASYAIYSDAASGAETMWVDSIGANATMLAYTTQPPASVVSGATFAANASVTYSNGSTVVPGRTDSITLSVCPSTPIATLTAASGLTKAAVNGTASWTDLVLTQPAGAVGVLLCAHTGTTGIADGTSSPINVTVVTPPVSELATPARIRARVR